MTAIFDLVARTPASILRGLGYLVEHPAAGVGVAILAIAVAATFHLHVRVWRRK